MADQEQEWLIIPDTSPVKFDSGEHADIPSECFLRFSADLSEDPLSGKSLKGTLWTQKNEKKNQLTFAKVIALSGDFFVNMPPKKIISFGQKFWERQERVKGGVDQLMRDPNELMRDGRIAYGLDGYLSNEANMMDDILDKGINVPDITEPEDKGVHNITMNFKGEKNGVMTTKMSFLMMKDGSYGDILAYNMDHFGQEAWEAYRAGHTVALQKAKDGGGNQQELKTAYLYDAFSLHYLSDQFSSGHIRTARIEFHSPSATLKVLSAWSGVTGLAYKGAWDGMTEIMHGTDNATGLRVSNQRGDQWIAYGDHQYFAASNRINRLKSIECVQASIDEVYETWRTGKYPKDYQAWLDTNYPNGDFKLGKNPNAEYNGFAALKIAPLPMGHTIKDNDPSNGNPAALWVVEKDPRSGTPKDTNRGDTPVTDPNAKPAALDDPINAKTPEAGFWYKRRVDVEDCSCYDYRYANPGYGSSGIFVSQDVADIEGSTFNATDRLPAQARAVELMAGGFIQVQEYPVEGGNVNYAVNVWGPVQVPIVYIYNKVVKEEGRQIPLKERLKTENRQMTFTWRGRRGMLRTESEAKNDNKNFRWRTWYDGKGKTSLLKFSFSQKSGIVVESWQLVDPDPRPEQQFTHFENLRPLVFGGPDNQPSKMAIKTTLLPNFSQTDWLKVAHVTRFFVLRFRPGASPDNPDLVTLSWKEVDGTRKPIISVASTENGLLAATLSFTSGPQPINTELPVLSGFIKRFENVNNKNMILYVRAKNKAKTAGPGITVVPQVFEHGDAPNSIKTDTKEVEILLATAPSGDDFYQVLVGDTRRCGHREMVVVTGDWQSGYYLSAWDLTIDGRWVKTSGDRNKSIPQSTKMTSNALIAQANKTPTSLQYQFCALLPNEFSGRSGNGLNVLMVSTYKDDGGKDVINFRTFVKEGLPPAAGSVTVQWDDGTETIVPASFCLPPSVDYQSKPNIDEFTITKSPGNILPSREPYLPPIPPYRWRKAAEWKDPAGNSKSEDFTFTSIFKPGVPWKDYGGYEAIASDSSTTTDGARCTIARGNGDPGSMYWFYFFDIAGKPIMRDGKPLRHLQGTTWRGAEDLDGPIEAEYFFDTKTDRPYATLYKRSRTMRYRITNPAIMFRAHAFGRAVPLPSTPNPPPVNAAPTWYSKAPPLPRPNYGWTEYIDSVVPEEFTTPTYLPHFHSMGWRLCRVASTVRKEIIIYGIMNIFSFHGVLGCRIFAPREAGEYWLWKPRGFVPYMGQSSLGTGYDSMGRWNDNISELGWGATEEFQDINIWNAKEKSWSKPSSMESVPYQRGFEAKFPTEKAGLKKNIPPPKPVSADPSK